MRKPSKPLSLAALAVASVLFLGACSGTTTPASGSPSTPSTSGSPNSAAAQDATHGGSSAAGGQAPKAAPGAASPSVAASPAQGATVPAWSKVAPSILTQLKTAKGLTVSGGTGKGAQKMIMSAKGSVSKTGDFEIDMTQAQNSITFKMMRVGGKVYLKGNEAAYRDMMGDDSGAMSKLIGDKYLLVTGQMLAELGDNFNLAGLRDELVKSTPAASTKMSATLGEYDGSPAFVYAAPKVTVYVSTDGSNRPLAYEEGAEAQSYVLSGWDQDYALPAPDPSKIMSMDELSELTQH